MFEVMPFHMDAGPKSLRSLIDDLILQWDAVSTYWHHVLRVTRFFHISHR